jgi:hypothetical protein
MFSINLNYVIRIERTSLLFEDEFIKMIAFINAWL